MATLIPSYEKILSLKVKPEDGELHLLKFLDSNLDESFEVYFNPYMNGDRPDIVIMRKGFGVMVIEVKDYNLDLYKLDDRKKFVIKSNNAKTSKSPISQVLKYKDNLYELHIDKLLEKKIKDIRNFNMVNSAVYFHNANSEQIDELLVSPFKEDFNYQKFLKYNIDLIGRDNLNELDFNKILKDRYLKADKPSFLFTDDIYESFKRFLKPPIHLKEQGKEIIYSQKQMEIIYESNKKEQRIKGVVGSGKTTILAARAVQAHKRTNGNVLILTYNITLRNYIKDKISDVREDFPWENFVISNYHLFINSELNNLGIPVEVPKEFNEMSDDEKDNFFESKFYSNKALFLERKEDIKTYDVILIDEIQDYKRAWMEIIKECFLSENGEYVLFGDVKQNIYNNTTDGKDISTNVRGVTELKNCFRSDFKIKDLAINYQKDIFKDKYEIDNFNDKATNLEFDFGRNQQGSLNYIYLSNTDNVASLYTIIHENAINKDVPPNDITILGHSISLLKKFDAYYRYSSNEKTNTMFETFEMVYRMGLNYIKTNNYPRWLKEGIILIKRQNDFKADNAFNQLSILFTIYDLYKEYGDRFKDKLDFYSLKFKTTTKDYLAFREKYESEINDFIKDFGPERQTSNLNMIRNNKKIHFHMNSGTVKISTVHSFKGWESETLFLILEKKFTKMQMTFDEILYTGITRSRANLVLINFGNEEYDKKLRTLIDKVK
ncbi:Type III restriction enzyme, res subunit [Flavobacterium succinicans]|uniref:DNA 3'-5' helicase II n=1 Tax=Flavobacterium succinicans TaxID=29536 RepID=A0A1I4XNL9_9FLAO|nr:NERD domain-containing protein [Flavobacterium succinicans]SFN27474.1 Type III restriction enzyme, res subunit [Flavobacterium succinicans]